MRNFTMGSMVALAAILTFLPDIMAQSAKQSGAVKAQTGAPIPDLSGVWSGRNLPNNFNPQEAPPMQPWAEERFKYNRDPKDPNNEGRNELNPSLKCFPHGIPRLLLTTRPIEIIQIPGRVLMLFERDHWVRQIWMDGREHPTDRAPNWLGHSTGRWEAGTLVVDTVGLNDLTWIDAAGHPHTEALHIVERFRRVDADTLENEITFDDPKVYTKPWTVTQRFKFHPDEEIMEDVVCEDHLMKEHLPKLIRGPKP